MNKLTKYLLISLFSCVLSIAAKAQDNDELRSMLFPQYEDGSVVLKPNYTRISVKLNYDTNSENFAFLDNGIAYELDINTVLFVLINDRYFLPFEDKFYYERVYKGNNEYYLRHKTKIQSIGKAAGYGTYSESSAITSVTSISMAGESGQPMAGQMVTLQASDKFVCVDHSALFLMRGKKYRAILSLKSLVKDFKPYQSSIESFAKNNRINFSKLEDVISIVEYAFSLSPTL